MCSCPPHLIETASQLSSAASSFGPFAATFLAALMGGKIGQFLLKFRRRARETA